MLGSEKPELKDEVDGLVQFSRITAWKPLGKFQVKNPDEAKAIGLCILCHSALYLPFKGLLGYANLESQLYHHLRW